MSVGWSYSPVWTGQRGGDWPEPVRRQLRLPAAKNGLKRDVEWSHSSGLKREVDWPNSLKRGVAWPFSRHPEENWTGSSGRDWDNLVDSPKTFTSKVGGQKYVTDQAAARWAARQSSSVRPSWWREAVEARSRERRRRLRRWRQRQWRLRQRAENRWRDGLQFSPSSLAAKYYKPWTPPTFFSESDWPGRSVPHHTGAGSDHLKRYLTNSLPEMQWSRQGLLGGLAINTRAVSGYAVDPYAVLALLGFMVFLFYIIYSFLNNSGNGKRSLEDETETVMVALVKYHQVPSTKYQYQPK